MTQIYDLTGNTLKVDGIEDSSQVVEFDTAVADPGDNATGDSTNPLSFNKVLKVTVSGTDYWIGLYDDNTTS